MCIFCKIIKKEIPAYILYEDEEVLAFLDISQVTKGHTLVVPKRHVEHMLACDDKTLQHVYTVAKNLAVHIMKQTQAEGMNILSNVNEAAGQTVPHFHIHLIPRYGADDSCVIAFHDSEKQDMDALQQLLKLSR